MIGLTNSLREMLQVKPVDTTNTVWRLHSRATLYVLIFSTILLSARAYFGEPIDCITSGSSAIKSSINSYCWTLGTYISKDPQFVDAKWDFVKIGRKMGQIPKEQRVYQKYYQWVSFLLTIQAFLLSLPKHLWRCFEGCRMATLCSGLTSIFPPDAWTTKRKRRTLHYLRQEPRSKQLKYAYLFIFCELLNFALVLLNMLLLNFIITGFWYNYQPAMQALMTLDMDTWMTHNSLVFPKIAKCEFSTVGPSGSTQNHDALCLLPQNIVNEKIFAFLWLWFICLAVISGMQIIFRMFQLSCQCVREKLLYFQLGSISYGRVQRLVREANFGQWFMLYQMSKNINQDVMEDIVIGLTKQESLNGLSKQSLEQPVQVEMEVNTTESEITI
ncbi:innexin inx2-like [Wyeomyia smithii]|uniref:innexin inx2-like n=1 Tax=Wyeomyia smithii TaxID=174621 RepID=UPI0024680665|nr:innexin inx2-like [Wyeomyia smithii]